MLTDRWPKARAQIFAEQEGGTAGGTGGSHSINLESFIEDGGCSKCESQHKMSLSTTEKTPGVSLVCEDDYVSSLVLVFVGKKEDGKERMCY